MVQSTRKYKVCSIYTIYCRVCTVYTYEESREYKVCCKVHVNIKCVVYILYIAAYVQCIRMKKVENIKYVAKYR